MRFRDLMEPRVRRVLVLGVVLAVFQQWCGINVIFNYAEEIFRAAGYDISSVLKNIAWTGSVNLVFTFVALGAVDRRGGAGPDARGRGRPCADLRRARSVLRSRRPGPAHALLVLAAIGCYAMSLAPVTWVIISEIFPNRIRGAAMSAAVASLWIACFILTYTFPILNARLGPGRHLLALRRRCALAGFVFMLSGCPRPRGGPSSSWRGTWWAGNEEPAPGALEFALAASADFCWDFSMPRAKALP